MDPATEVSQLLKNNFSTDSPYTISGANNTVTITLNLADAKFYTLFQQNGLKKSFSVIINLDVSSKTAKISNEEYELSWEAGVPKLGAKIQITKGTSYTFEKAAEVGYTPGSGVGVAYSYSLNSRDVNKQVKSILQANGWKLGMDVNTKRGLIGAGFGLIAVVIGLIVAYLSSN